MKIGFDQLNKPAPLWFRRVLNAAIIFVMPAFTGFVMGMPITMMSTDAKNLCVSIGVFVLAMLKALEYVVGDSAAHIQNPDIDNAGQQPQQSKETPQVPK